MIYSKESVTEFSSSSRVNEVLRTFVLKRKQSSVEQTHASIEPKKLLRNPQTFAVNSNIDSSHLLNASCPNKLFLHSDQAHNSNSMITVEPSTAATKKSDVLTTPDGPQISQHNHSKESIKECDRSVNGILKIFLLKRKLVSVEQT